MRTNTKKILWFMAVIDVVVFIAVVGLVVYVNFERNNLKAMGQELAETRRKVTDVESVENLISETTANRQALKQLFVDKDSVIDFLATIEKLGDQTGADVEVISVSEDKGSKGSSIKIRFEVMGTWNQVYRTILMLDHFPSTLSFSALDLRKVEKEEGEKDYKPWRASFDGNVLKTNKTN